MSNATTSQSPPDKKNIQGLILRGYTHPYSAHLLFNFKNNIFLPDFFTTLLPYLVSAENWGDDKPQMMLNIGLTWPGINVIKPEFAINNKFQDPFVSGPESQTSQLNLCDTGNSAPVNWWNQNSLSPKGQKFKTADIHCVVHTYAMSADALATLVGTITEASLKSNGTITELLPLDSTTGRLEQYSLLKDYIHFDYRDSIDEPSLNPDSSKQAPGNLNNFLIGYNSDGSTTPIPTGNSPQAKFALNGCYNAFRILYQDVQAFEDFLDQHAPKVAPMLTVPGDVKRSQIDYAREWLAGKLNGRWRDGTPMELSPDKEDPSKVEITDFQFTDMSQALKCPYSAHTRVANPRNTPLTPIFAQSGGVPEILRRGVAYGAPLNKNNAKEDRGLIGMFLCGDFASQFEKLYAWMNNNDFSTVYPPGVYFPQDALVANRASQSTGIDPSFTIQIDANNSYTIDKLPPFVTTRGTAYCLLPSIASITAIANKTL